MWSIQFANKKPTIDPIKYKLITTGNKFQFTTRV